MQGLLIKIRGINKGALSVISPFTTYIIPKYRHFFHKTGTVFVAFLPDTHYHDFSPFLLIHLISDGSPGSQLPATCLPVTSPIFFIFSMKPIHCLFSFTLILCSAFAARGQQRAIFTLNASSVEVRPDSTFTVQIRGWHLKDISTLQIPLRFNREEAEYLGMDSVLALPGITSSYYTPVEVTNRLNRWVVSWNDAFPFTFPTVPDGTLLFSLRFKMKDGAGATFTLGVGSPGVEVSQFNNLLPVAPTAPLYVASLGLPPRRNTFSLYANPLQIKKGEIGCMPVTTDHFEDIFSMMYAIHYDPNVLEAVAIQKYNLPIDSLLLPLSDWFNVKNDLGTILTVWMDVTNRGHSVNNSTVLYEVCFKAIGDEGSFSAIDINGEGFASTVQGAEIVNRSMQNLALPGFGVSDTIRIVSTGQISTGNEESAVHERIGLRAQPVQFSTGTLLTFELEEATKVHLNVFDAQGRVVWQQKGHFGVGTHTVAVQKEDLGASGTYYAVLQTSRGQRLCKLVVL